MTLCDCSAVLAVVMRNVCMIVDQNRPQIDKNQPKSIKSQSESIQRKIRFQVPSQSSKGLCFFGAFWHHLADFGRHFVPDCIHRGPNLDFGHLVRKIMKKGCPKTRPEKTFNFDRIFSQNEMASEVKVSAWQGICCKITMFVVS